jgi:hypothetical protein
MFLELIYFNPEISLLSLKAIPNLLEKEKASITTEGLFALPTN